MRKNIALILVGLFSLIMILTTVSAYKADVAYIVTTSTSIKGEFIQAINELELTYSIILAKDVGSTDFSEYKMMLINDQYFTNWDEIPVNDYPSVVVNGINIDNWGWTTRVTTTSMGVPMHVLLNKTYEELTAGLDENIQVYTRDNPDMYYLDKNYIYDGVEIIASTTSDSEDTVVGLAIKGTNLTRAGKPDTVINADTIFFGIKDTKYWTEDTITLFKNCLGYVSGNDVYLMELNTGKNFVSVPILISDKSVSAIMSENEDIDYIKEYNGNSIVNSGVIENEKGYIIYATSPTTISFEGASARTGQSLSLAEGMNLVGFTLNSGKAFDSINVPSQVIEISKRDSDEKFIVSTKYGGVWFNSFNLEPGESYWVKTNDAVVWSYDP